MVEVEQENTFNRALTEGINLFLGSGFSLLATDASGHQMPTGSTVFDELVTEFRVPNAAGLTLSQLCTVIDATRREQLYTFLKRRFSVATFDQRYRHLDLLTINSIFTTNIDDLLFKLYACSTSHYLHDIVVRGPAHSDKSAVDIVTLHGSVAHQNEPLAFSTLEIASSFSADPDKWHLLTGRLQRYPTIFWGYSLNDAGVLQALSPVTVRGRIHQDKWLFLPAKD